MLDPTRLRNILSQQKLLLTQLEKETNVIFNTDSAKENAILKKELEQLKQTLAKKTEKLKTVSEQNATLKNALFEQVYSEKISILSTARKKNDAYFKATEGAELNKLAALEKNLQARTKQLKAQLEMYSCTAHDEILNELNALSGEAAIAVTEAKAEAARLSGAFTAYSEEQFDALKKEQITDDVVAAIGKKNNFEAFIGGNLINKVGIVFIILGIITVSQLTFLHLPDTLRGVVMFAISGLLLLGGELLNRRKPNIFSLGVTSGGVAGLYASLSISYFMLEIIAMMPALLLCLMITAVAFVLSTRYSSQTIAAFALIGGYIPIISISDSIVLTYSAMVYFVILNLLALMLSSHKNWKISMFIGFVLNLMGTVYIVSHMHTLWRSGQANPAMFVIIYILFAFAIYTVIPILSSYRTKIAFAMPDVILLGLNTVISALILYSALLMFNLDDYTGVMALAFAVIYIGLGWYMERLFASERKTIALFYLTGLTFVVLVVPMQFGTMWLSLGWLVQAVSLTCYGILTDEKRFKKIGFIIGGLCLAAFIAFDVIGFGRLFAYKYFAVTAGSIMVLYALAYKKSLSHIGERILKYAVLINGWFYCLYAVNLSSGFIRNQLFDTPFNPWFLLGAMSITVTFLFAALLPRIPIIASRGTKILSVCLSVIGMLMLMGHLQFDSIVRGTPPFGIMLIATIVLIALCALALLTMYNVLMFFTLERGRSVEWLPLSVSAYFLVILTQTLVAQYGLAVTSMFLSIIFVVAALAWIVYGFIKRFAYMRRFGLALSIMAVAKLFLVDLPVLTDGHRIVSYFAFGATLLGISFVYQYFSKRLALKVDDIEEAASDE